MALDRDGLVTEICDVVGKSVSALAVSGASLQDRVVTYLNFAQRRIAKIHSFYELNVLDTTPVTVADVKRYPIETGTNTLGLTRVKDIQSIRLIDSENSRKLERWHYRKFDRYYPRPANYSTDRPRIYTRRGDFLELFRIPNDAYSLSITYSQWPQELTAGAQESDFTNKDQLLITAGTLEIYLALEEYADARVWFERFRGQLSDAIKAEGDVDWEPEAEPFAALPDYGSGTPYTDPYGEAGDPLYGYPE
jgi:hypothetical protein